MATEKKAVKEEIEAKVAVSAVEEAEKKVEDIKTKKKAALEARCAKREQWRGPFKVVGKIVNAYDREPVKMWGATLAGGAAGAGAVKLVEKAINHFSAKKADEVVEASTDETDEEVVDTTPFD